MVYFGSTIESSFLLSHPEMSTNLLKKQQHPDRVRISEMGILLLSTERCTRITNRTKKNIFNGILCWVRTFFYNNDFIEGFTQKWSFVLHTQSFDTLTNSVLPFFVLSSLPTFFLGSDTLFAPASSSRSFSSYGGLNTEYSHLAKGLPKPWLSWIKAIETRSFWQKRDSFAAHI